MVVCALNQLGDKWRSTQQCISWNQTSVDCCDIAAPLIKFPIWSIFFHPLASLWAAAADLLLRMFHYFHTSVIGERLRAVWDTRGIIWPDSVQKTHTHTYTRAEMPAGGTRCLMVSSASSFELLKGTQIHWDKVLMTGKQTVTGQSDIHLQRQRIMFKITQLQGADWPSLRAAIFNWDVARNVRNLGNWARLRDRKPLRKDNPCLSVAFLEPSLSAANRG